VESTSSIVETIQTIQIPLIIDLGQHAEDKERKARPYEVPVEEAISLEAFEASVRDFLVALNLTAISLPPPRCPAHPRSFSPLILWLSFIIRRVPLWCYGGRSVFGWEPPPTKRSLRRAIQAERSVGVGVVGGAWPV
jgi:hypothetical protein